MSLVVHLLIEDGFNVVFVVMFDLVDVLAVLAKDLLLTSPSVEFEPVGLLDSHLHFGDFVGLPPCQIDLGKDASLLQL